MNIQEMHSAFRTIGQQMGLQLVRGILPESIDVFLNNVIQEKIQQEVYSGVRTVVQETVDTQASTMSNVNILKDLYRTDRLLVDYPMYTSKDTIVQGEGENIIEWDKSKEFEGGGLIDYYNPENSYHEYLIPLKGKEFKTWSANPNENLWIDTSHLGTLTPMLFLGVSVEYPETKRGNSIPCRMIGADVLDTTFRDFCNGASKENPVVSLLSKTDAMTGINRPYLQIYINSKETVFKAITIKHIKQPNVVKHDLDLSKCVNCDLPEYCHYELVERAVIKYKASIGGVYESRDEKQ